MTSTTLRTGRELAVVGIVGTLSLLGGLLMLVAVIALYVYSGQSAATARAVASHR